MVPSFRRIPTLPDTLVANIVLAWRAAARSPAFLVVGGLMAALGLAGPVLATTFLFFVEEHTRAELIATNVVLWSAVFAFLLLPRAAASIRGKTLPAFNALVPAAAEAVVFGRYLGVLGAYLGVALLQLVPAALLEAFVFAGRPLLLATLGLLQIVLGAVLVSAVLFLAQAGSALFTGLCAVTWFLIGTQKAGWIASVDPGWSHALLSAAFAWLPDFALLSPGPFADSSSGPGALGLGLRIVYGLLFVSLHLLLAATLVRLQWRGSRPGRDILTGAIRRLR